MALFKPISEVRDLPKVDVGFEHVTLDAKTSARPQNAPPPGGPFQHPELAKDIAAFANALGGVILVGAQENRARGVIEKYVPLSDEEATATVTAYNTAANEFSSPTPFIDPQRISVEGRVIVAINVWPELSQLVGFSESGRGAAGRHFAFPQRSGNNTIWIEPEKHTMFMIPSIRRTVILLESIPKGEKVTVIQSPPASAGPGLSIFHGLNVYTNTAKFQHEQKIYTVPLDAIERIWKEATGNWLIRIEGGASWR